MTDEELKAWNGMVARRKSYYKIYGYYDVSDEDPVILAADAELAALRAERDRLDERLSGACKLINSALGDGPECDCPPEGHICGWPQWKIEAREVLGGGPQDGVGIGATIKRLYDERDMWRAYAEQRIALRKEIEELLGMADGETYTDRGMKKALRRIRALVNGA